MHICAVSAGLWLVGSCILAFIEKPEAIRRYHWRVVFWLALTGPYVFYRISVAVWMKTC